MAFGAVTFDEPEEVVLAPNASEAMRTVQVSRGRWTPPKEMTDLRQHGIVLPLVRYEFPDGRRRHLADMGYEGVLRIAPEIGLAIVRLGGRLSSEDASMYQGMFQIFRAVRGDPSRGHRGMQPHLSRRFKTITDLHVKRGSRDESADLSILPADLGFVAGETEEHKPWGIERLLKEGSEGNKVANSVPRTFEESISYGFLAGARRNPLVLEKRDDVVWLLRTCLFDDAQFDPPPSEEIVAHVYERLGNALNKHREDDSDTLAKWVYGPKSSLISQIAKQKKAPGGVLNQNDVRRAILHIGWNSYRYVGDCVHACMYYVAKALGSELAGSDRTCFEQVYLRQTYLADLPLVVIGERLDFVRPLIVRFWPAGPQGQDIAVLYRLLQWYGSMAASRRAADLCGKRNAQARRVVPAVDGETSAESAARPGTTSNAKKPAPGRGELKDVLFYLAERKGALKTCRCTERAYEVSLVDETTFELVVRCGCPAPPQFQISLTELQREGSKYMAGQG
jgi:hypothetical protein